MILDKELYNQRITLLFVWIQIGFKINWIFVQICLNVLFDLCSSDFHHDFSNCLYQMRINCVYIEIKFCFFYVVFDVHPCIEINFFHSQKRYQLVCYLRHCAAFYSDFFCCCFDFFFVWCRSPWHNLSDKWSDLFFMWLCQLPTNKNNLNIQPQLKMRKITENDNNNTQLIAPFRVNG